MAPASAQPLAGLVVLDLSRVLAGPYATQMLGDLGAEVWKVERAGVGDETRAWGPPFVGDESAYFLSVNRNKLGVALDFQDAAHRDAVRRAAAQADVVVENFLPGDLARFQLDAATLRRGHPELIVCSISGYGQDGPYASLPGYDAVMQGFTGLMSVTGDPNGPPTKVGVAVIDVLAGVHAATAILAAMVGRLRGGSGAHLDVALAEVGIASLVNLTQSALATGVPARRHGNAHPQIVPYQTFEARDGSIVVAVGNDEQWLRLCDALGANELGADATFRRNPDRVLHREEVVSALGARIARASRDELLAKLHAARVPAGPVRDLGEVITDPALRERGLIHTTESSSGGPLEFLALPWKSDGDRPSLRRLPPRLGQHNAEFFDRFGS